MGMFPLSTVLFPHAPLPLHVFEERYKALMGDCMATDGVFGVVLITRGSEVGGGDQRVDVGTIARVTHLNELEDGRMLVMARGVERVRVERWLDESPYPRAQVGDLPLGRGDADAQAVAAAVAAAEQAVRRLRSLLSELGQVPALPHDLALDGDLEETGWRLCDLAPLALIDRQRLLTCSGLIRQMELLCELSTAMAGDVVSLLADGGAV
jgi:Lon protease-like protein